MDRKAKGTGRGQPGNIQEDVQREEKGEGERLESGGGVVRNKEMEEEEGSQMEE